MKTLKNIGLAALALGVMTFNASAIYIVDPTQPAPVTFFQENGNVDADDVEDELNLAFDITEVYKQNVGGAEEKSFAGSYTTTFNPALNPTGATITYDGAPDPYITGTHIYLLAKDGSTGHYLWDISDWDGQEQIQISGLYPGGQGSISHVSIFTAGGTSVPDAGTSVALLGLAFGALGLMRRKLA